MNDETKMLDTAIAKVEHALDVLGLDDAKAVQGLKDIVAKVDAMVQEKKGLELAMSVPAASLSGPAPFFFPFTPIVSAHEILSPDFQGLWLPVPHKRTGYPRFEVVRDYRVSMGPWSWRAVTKADQTDPRYRFPVLAVGLTGWHNIYFPLMGSYERLLSLMSSSYGGHYITEAEAHEVLMSAKLTMSQYGQWIAESTQPKADQVHDYFLRNLLLLRDARHTKEAIEAHMGHRYNFVENRWMTKAEVEAVPRHLRYQFNWHRRKEVPKTPKTRTLANAFAHVKV